MDAGQLVILLISAGLIGLSKAGFSGVSLISVYLLVDKFGAKESLGVALPMLVMADLMVYPAFRKYGSWSDVWRILWPALIGIAAAYWFLGRASDDLMRLVIGWIILTMVSVQLLKSLFPKALKKLAHSHGFGIFAGWFGGVASMLANAGGPVMQLYLLSREMPKMQLVGVGVRFFLVVNLIKLPLNAGLELLTWRVFCWDLVTLPVLWAGIYLGKKWLILVPQIIFERMVIVCAVAAGLSLICR